MGEFALVDRALTSIFDALASVPRPEPVRPLYHFHVTIDGETVECQSEAALFAWLAEHESETR